MTPHAWEIALWAHRRWKIAEHACGLSKPLKDKPAFNEWSTWMDEEALYAEILALSIYADEPYFQWHPRYGGSCAALSECDPHALLDWLRDKKAKHER